MKAKLVKESLTDFRAAEIQRQQAKLEAKKKKQLEKDNLRNKLHHTEPSYKFYEDMLDLDEDFIITNMHTPIMNQDIYEETIDDVKRLVYKASDMLNIDINVQDEVGSFVRSDNDKANQYARSLIENARDLIDIASYKHRGDSRVGIVYEFDGKVKWSPSLGAGIVSYSFEIDEPDTDIFFFLVY